MAYRLITPQAQETIMGHKRPAHYGDFNQEYQQLLTEGGYLEDHGWAWLTIKGADASSFLQGMLTLDVHKLALGSSQEGFALDASGKILGLVRLCKIASDHLLLACHPDYCQQIATHLNKFIITEDVSITNLENRFLVVICGSAGQNLEQNLFDGCSETCFKAQRAGMHCLDIVVEAENAEVFSRTLSKQSVNPIGWQAWNAYRIEALYPYFPVDIAPETNPVIYGLAGAISAHKGCYIGQETVAMTRDRGRPPFGVALLGCHHTLPDSTELQFQHQNKPAGSSHSHCFSPKHKTQVCLAVLKHKMLADGIQQVQDTSGRAWNVLQIHTLTES